MTTITGAPDLGAIDQATIARIGMNLAAYREADWTKTDVHTSFGPLLSVNVDELLDIIARLARTA